MEGWGHNIQWPQRRIHKIKCVSATPREGQALCVDKYPWPFSFSLAAAFILIVIGSVGQALGIWVTMTKGEENGQEPRSGLRKILGVLGAL